MKNRFGHTIRPGMTVIYSHPRGGTFRDTVERLETVRDKDANTRAFVRAYGPRAVLKGGSTVALDDCTPFDA